MMVLISYDVATASDGGKRRLRRVAKACKNFGQRVQYSVFECMLDPSQLTYLRNQLVGIIDKNQDSLRFYLLGANWKNRVEHYGAKQSFDQEGPLIV
jgi:CRISPR-associated protein Cas2